MGIHLNILLGAILLTLLINIEHHFLIKVHHEKEYVHSVVFSIIILKKLSKLFKMRLIFFQQKPQIPKKELLGFFLRKFYVLQKTIWQTV